MLQQAAAHHMGAAGLGEPGSQPGSGGVGPMVDMMGRLPPGLSALVNPQQAYAAAAAAAAAAAMRFPFPLSALPKSGAMSEVGGNTPHDNNNGGGSEKTGHCGELDLSTKKHHIIQSPYHRLASIGISDSCTRNSLIEVLCRLNRKLYFW
jgi:hypothetical protein